MLNAAQTVELQRNVRRVVDKSVKNILWNLKKKAEEGKERKGVRPSRRNEKDG
jgi:hypothetical protein